jgi:hypothetical protein
VNFGWPDGEDVLSRVRVSVNPRDLKSFNREKAIGFVVWIRSEEGRAWSEDLKERDSQYRRIASEHLGAKVWRFSL